MSEKQHIPELIVKLEAAREKRRSLKMLIGVDGYVDAIVHVVDQRLDANNYTRINTISDFAARIARAAGLSTNIEFVVTQTKLGGNGPILANALIEYGTDITYFGAIGDGKAEPVFAGIAERGKAYPICMPCNTDAVEFDDGKLIVGKGLLDDKLSWETIKARLGGVQHIADILNECDLLGIENWTMVLNMNGIWEGMIAELFPLLKYRDEKPFAFFDLCDPERRPVEDLKHGLELIGKFESKFRAILGLNKKEAFDIAKAYGIEPSPLMSEAQQLEAVTTQLYAKLSIYCLVVHPTREAAACINGEYFHVNGPFTPNPKLTTGAGDNFNAGFCLGKTLNLSARDSLLLAVATSGFYVRNAKSPTFDDVIGFLKIWKGELS